MARPYACSDQPVPPVTARQLNALVLLALIERMSSPPYTSIGCMRWIGNRAL